MHLRKTLLLDRKFLARHISVFETHLADTVALYGYFLVTAVDAVTLLGFIHAAYYLADFLFDGSFGVVEVQFALFQADLFAAYLVLGTSPVHKRVRDGQGDTTVGRAVAHIIERRADQLAYRTSTPRTQSCKVVIGGDISFELPFAFGAFHFDGLQFDVQVVFLYLHTVAQRLIDGLLHVDDKSFKLHIRFQVDLLFQIQADQQFELVFGCRQFAFAFHHAGFILCHGDLGDQHFPFGKVACFLFQLGDAVGFAGVGQAILVDLMFVSQFVHVVETFGYIIYDVHLYTGEIAGALPKVEFCHLHILFQLIGGEDRLVEGEGETAVDLVAFQFFVILL